MIEHESLIQQMCSITRPEAYADKLLNDQLSSEMLKRKGDPQILRQSFAGGAVRLSASGVSDSHVSLELDSPKDALADH